MFSDSKTRSRFLYHTPADVADSRYQPPEGRLSSGPEAEPVRDVFLNKDTFLLRGYLSASGSRVGQVLEMFKKKESKPKVRVLFVEQKNDFASQMAEYFAR